MKVNWFSPLPFAKTDIAHYTSRILQELAKRCDITLWTDQCTWDADLTRFAKVRSFEFLKVNSGEQNWSMWSELNKADISFYNIGNNPNFHESIWQISRYSPGIIVLHDIHLQHFFAEIFLNKWRDSKSFKRQMLSFYGQEGLVAVDDFLGQRMSIEELSVRYPLTELAIGHSLGAVIHNPSILSAGFMGSIPVCCQPLPFLSTPIKKTVKTKKRCIPYRLVVFGYIGTNRRLEEVLEALASFSEIELFKLDVYGELYDRSFFEKKIQDLSLQDIVRIHGFVAEDELDAALSHADMAFNLRFPTMGESSASQLRIWNHALPSMVSRVGWYETLSEKAVVFVDPGKESEDIHRHLQSFLGNPDGFIRKGLVGKEILTAEHTPSAYAQALIDFAEIVVTRRAQSSSGPLAVSVGKELHRWLPHEYSDHIVESVASQIYKMSH